MSDVVPIFFRRKKERILKALSVPDSEYSDLSPKGSVDVQIRELIDEINAIPGLVTTSSCSGRVSVFVEGRKGAGKPQKTVNDENQDGDEESDAFEKSLGGRWLYVSHDPVDLNLEDGKNWHLVFGLNAQSTQDGLKELNAGSSLIHFKFEPMILHLQAASLQDANSVLIAANQAGFRESGALNLSQTEDGTFCPMVAVRSMGLGFDSVIGIQDQDGNPFTIIEEKQLEFLVHVANQRFEANLERINRFRANLKQVFWRVSSNIREDPEVRRQRKRAEGLIKRTEQQKKKTGDDANHEDDDLYAGGLLGIEDSL